MGEYGFGVVGAGVIGAFHAAAIAIVPSARLVAVTDVDPGRAAAFADRHGCVAAPDLDALTGRELGGSVRVEKLEVRTASKDVF